MTPAFIIKVASISPKIKIEVWAIIPMQIITVSIVSAVMIILSVKPPRCVYYSGVHHACNVFGNYNLYTLNHNYYEAHRHNYKTGIYSDNILQLRLDSSSYTSLSIYLDYVKMRKFPYYSSLLLNCSMHSTNFSMHSSEIWWKYGFTLGLSQSGLVIFCAGRRIKIVRTKTKKDVKSKKIFDLLKS